MKKTGLALLLVLAVFSFGVFAADTPVAHDTSSSRSVTLSDMGLTETVLLGERNSEQHFYLPMPQGVRFARARFELSATYSQPFPGDAVLTVSINGLAKLIQPLKSSGVPIELVLPINDAEPKAGVLDVGIALSTRMDASHCYDQRGKGIELAVDTHKTRLVYAYANSEIDGVDKMLATLPHHPVVLIPSNTLDAPQYQAVLRIVQALSGIGLQPELVAVPKIGESASVAGLDASGQMLPALRQAIESGTRFAIRDADDLGAWLRARLEAENGLAQVVFDAAATRQALRDAYAASRMQGAVDAWLDSAVQDKSNIELMALAGYPVLAIGKDNVEQAVKLIGADWKRIAKGAALTVMSAADLRKSKQSKAAMHIARDFPLRVLNGDGEWQIPFNLRDIPPGRWPDAFELNVMASPGSDGKSPVAAVLLNDNLLTAALLNTNGQLTRITVHIPLYAVRSSNVLKIRVSHRVESGLCSGVSQAMPVQLLPTSFLSLKRAPEPSQFFMLDSMLSRHGDVIVPQRYLQDVTDSLPAVSAILNGMAVGGEGFDLKVNAGKEFVPENVFVAFETAPQEASELVTTQTGRLVIRNSNGEAVFDSTGMKEMAVMQLVESHRQYGVYVLPVSGRLPVFQKPFEVAMGNLAVADAQGVRLVVNVSDPDNNLELDEQNRGIKLFFHHYRIWLIVLGVLMLPVLAMLGLRLYYRRRNLQA